MPYIIECSHCDKDNDLSQAPPNSLVACQHCNASIYHVGVMPMPDPDVPNACDLLTWMNQQGIPDSSPDDLPPKVCPWCGRNVGARKECGGCQCDLTKTGKLKLQEFVRQLGPVEIGLLHGQAMHPIATEAQLIRLHRLTKGQAYAIAGTKIVQFAQRLPTAIQPPPGCMDLESRELTPKQIERGLQGIEKSWWQFWK